MELTANQFNQSAVIAIEDITLQTALDRGTTQAIGVVSDAGTFLPLLAKQLEIQSHPSKK